MKKTVKAAACFLSLALFLGVFSPARQQRVRMALEEVLSIGSLEEALLYQWVGVTTDAEGAIYVTDAMDYSLKKFDAGGNLLKTAGRRGDGPGEFSAPRAVDSSGHYVFVSEEARPFLTVFDKDLKYVTRMRLPGPVGDLKVLSDDRVAVVAITVENRNMVCFCDLKGRVLQKINYSGEKGSFIWDMASLEVDAEGNIYLAYTFVDRLLKLSPEGKRLWSRKLLSIKRIEKKKVGSFVVPTEVVYKDVALDPEGRVYVLGGHFSRNPSRDVYVLDPDGRHVGSLTLPEASHCIHVDSRGFLYARANEGVTLKKFRILWDRR